MVITRPRIRSCHYWMPRAASSSTPRAIRRFTPKRCRSCSSSLSWQKPALPPPPSYPPKTSPPTTPPSNRVAMAIQASWWIASLKEQMKEDYANVGTAPVPGPEAGEKGSLAYAFFTGVNSGSKHKKEGWEFLTWLNSAKNKEGVTEMGDFLAGNGLIPPRKADAAILGPKLQAKDANLTPIYDAASYAMAESNAANDYKAKTSLHNSLNEILVNKAPVDQIFKSLASEINRK